MSKTIIQMKDVNKWFGEFQVLKNIINPTAKDHWAAQAKYAEKKISYKKTN